MVDLILWNSIANRRRSPSDTFLENGLGTLKSYIEKQGFNVHIIDWATSDYWETFTPKILSKINRYLATKLISSGNRNKLLTYFIKPVFLLSQSLMSRFQERAMYTALLNLAKSFRKDGCPVLGIKVWYGEAYRAAKTFANLVHTLAPEILIVAGGPHATIYREAILGDNVFDISVIGEGERALSAILGLARRTYSKNNLLDKIIHEAKNNRLKNVVYRDGSEIKITTIDKADANKKNIPTYDNMDGKTRIHVVVDSLGCEWAKCNFCVHSNVYPDHTLRDPQSVIDEIETMISKDIGIFRFAGSSSSLDHICEIARLLTEKDIKIIYSMFARSVPKSSEEENYRKIVESYRLLIRTGLRAVFVGGESADDKILKSVMGKGLCKKEIIATIKAMKQAAEEEGLPLDIGLSLIYPTPTMREMSLEKLKLLNIELVEETNPDSVLVNPPAPFPGTTWFNHSTQFGFELGQNFVQKMLNYDYVLYKPPNLWPDIDLKLEEMDFHQILNECQNLRKSLEENGVVTEVTDEHFLMMRASGYTGREGALTFKQNALLDILSCDYKWINNMQEKVNQTSRAQARLNRN
ncbi:MAG: cobalamin-dependent protein [Candidatus Latescibacteria bacterium]|nr:cobalamin-dependent protein [Candidatus Latescibacterota bacterium]